jgi:alanine racemase
MRRGCRRGISSRCEAAHATAKETKTQELFTSTDIPPSATGVLAVDLGALRRNYRMLREKAGAAECAAVVKGDGYGLGAGPVAAALAAEGCRTFFVATFSEAERLRAGLPEAAIYVLDGLFPGSAPEFRRHGLRPVLGDFAEIEEWAAFCRAEGIRLPAAVHIDSGMNRLGLKAEGRRRLLEKPEILGGFSLSLLMSHLVCADTPEHPKNPRQREDFADFAAQLQAGAPLSLANSAGIFLGPAYAFDLVRPGIALYGGNPFSGRPNPMEPVVTLYGRIAQIGEADAGETVGYGAGLTLMRRTRYATVSVGYADGYFRALGSRDGHPGAAAFLGDHALPILGRVSMDLIVFDITDVPAAQVVRGGFVELIGRNYTVDDAAAQAGTIAYEILTSLGPRYTRIYLGAEDGAQSD